MPIPLGILAVAGAVAPVAAGDYELITTTVLGTATASVTFSNLGDYSSTYRHLQIRLVANNSGGGGDNWFLRLNGDTGANYVGHYLVGTGSQVLSGKTTNTTELALGIVIGTQFGASVADILDAYQTKNKTIRALAGNTARNRIDLMSGLWMNTASITSLNILPSSGSWISGSRFSLYGVK